MEPIGAMLIIVFAVVGGIIIYIAGQKDNQDNITQRALAKKKMHYHSETGEIICDDPDWNYIINNKEK